MMKTPYTSCRNTKAGQDNTQSLEYSVTDPLIANKKTKRQAQREGQTGWNIVENAHW